MKVIFLFALVCIAFYRAEIKKPSYLLVKMLEGAQTKPGMVNGQRGLNKRKGNEDRKGSKRRGHDDDQRRGNNKRLADATKIAASFRRLSKAEKRKAAQRQDKRFNKFNYLYQ